MEACVVPVTCSLCYVLCLIIHLLRSVKSVISCGSLWNQIVSKIEKRTRTHTHSRALPQYIINYSQLIRRCVRIPYERSCFTLTQLWSFEEWFWLHSNKPSSGSVTLHLPIDPLSLSVFFSPNPPFCYPPIREIVAFTLFFRFLFVLIIHVAWSVQL